MHMQLDKLGESGLLDFKLDSTNMQTFDGVDYSKYVSSRTVFASQQLLTGTGGAL